MKFSSCFTNKVLLFFFAILFCVTAWKQGWFCCSHNAVTVQQRSSDNLSVIAQSCSNHPQHLLSLPAAGVRVPSPLNYPSEEELHEFPGATVVEATEIDGPDSGQKTRIRILKTHFKYPFIRIEEVVDSAKNGVVTREEMAADHLLVTLPEGESPEVFLKHFGPQAVSIIQVTEGIPLYRINLASLSLTTFPAILQASSKTSAITAEPDFIIHTSGADSNRRSKILSDPEPATTPPNDFNPNYQWGLSKTIAGEEITCHYSQDGTVTFTTNTLLHHGINAEDAWLVRTSAASVVVAVIDSGIRYTHEDLAANMWHNSNPTNQDLYGWNAVNNSGDPMDDFGHGTKCAGIIGAVGNNGVGICGVAWKVQLMACKCTDSQGIGLSSDEIICLEYARKHGATIFNCSIASPMYSQAENDALNRARLEGIIVVCAAGNITTASPDGSYPTDSNGIPLYPSSSDNDLNPIYPACNQLDNIVSVGALDGSDELAYFSHYGAQTVHLAAPGEMIYSTTAVSDSSYNSGDGTSFAAPYVVGAFALLQAEYPNVSYKKLINHLLATTLKLPTLEGRTISGGTLDIGNAMNMPLIFSSN